MSTTQAPKKRGSASDFKGSRAQFLEQWADDYMEASRQKTLSKFWPRIFPQYWMNFSWQLALTEDPAGHFLSTRILNGSCLLLTKKLSRK
jgi:hypothetical protein